MDGGGGVERQYQISFNYGFVGRNGKAVHYADPPQPADQKVRSRIDFANCEIWRAAERKRLPSKHLLGHSYDCYSFKRTAPRSRCQIPQRFLNTTCIPPIPSSAPSGCDRPEQAERIRGAYRHSAL